MRRITLFIKRLLLPSNRASPDAEHDGCHRRRELYIEKSWYPLLIHLIAS